jgi:pimeloyl-ACP methyl ester carboxylesterase
MVRDKTLQSYQPVVVREETIAAGGYHTFFRCAGSGQPLILLHGSRRSSVIWQSNISDLATRFEVIAPDRPGYGSSEKIKPGRKLPDMADWANEFAKSLGHEKPSWIGESRGGSIVIELASRFQAAEKIVLVAPAGLPPSELPKPDIKPESPKFEFDEWQWFLERSIDAQTSSFDSLRNTALRDIQASRDYEERRVAELTADYNRRGLLEQIIGVKCETMLVWGRQDPVFPVENVERFRDVLPNLTQTLIIDRARHLPFVEHPALFNREVLKFLAHPVVS